MLAETLLEQDSLPEASQLLAVTAPSAELEARRQADLAFAYLRGHDNMAALRSLDAASKLNPRSRDLVGKIEMLRGSAEMRMERPDDAERSFRRALSAVKGTGSLIESYTLSNLGFLYLTLFRYDEAVFYFDQARAIADHAGARRALLLALGNLGSASAKLGDVSGAIAFLSRASSVAESLGDRSYESWLQVELAWVYHEIGELAKAIDADNRVRQLAAPGIDDKWRVFALEDLSQVAMEMGDMAQAARFNTEGANLARGKDIGEGVKLDTRLDAAMIAAARGRPEAESFYREAIRDSQELKEPAAAWIGHAGLAKLYQTEGNVAGAEREYAATVTAIESQRSLLSKEESKFGLLSRLIPFYRDYVDFLVERHDLNGAFRVAESCRAQVLAERLRAEHGVATADLDRLKAEALASGDVFLSYWLAPKRSFLWVIDRSGSHEFELPPEKEIEDRVTRYAAAIDGERNPLENENAAGRWLFDQLIGSRVHPGAGGKVVIEPDGCLHQLNFETLPRADGKAFWIADATVTVTPSLAILHRAKGSGNGNLLLFGDPLFQDASMAKLTHARAEVKAVSLHFHNPGVFTGPGATPANWLAHQPGNFSILHFATHADANAESPLDSAILLAGAPGASKLYARDVMTQKLTATLVTLSACKTAGGKTYRGEGLTGFAWAFLASGAQNVVAGLWDADDQAASLLMPRFYDALAAGLPPAAALRKAKLELMASSPVYRKPYYWAPFEVFTGALAP